MLSRPALAGPKGRRLLALLARALLAPLALGGCQAAVLDPMGPISAANRTILIDSLAIMLAIVLPTIAATLGFAWWFRATNTKALHRPDWAYSGQIEVITWSIPLLTITLLGGVAWVGSHMLDPARPLQSETPTLEVQVVSLDWKWLFIYPTEKVASVNRLVIPVGVPVHFTITSASVMNAFFIPQLGSMIYTMNGMQTDLNLLSDEPGTYMGLSSHYSGDGFSGMHFEVQALASDGFAAWVAATRGTGPTLDGQGYRELSKQTISVAPFTYRTVDPDLFRNVLSQALPPGPGPVPQTNPGQGQK